MFGLYSMPHVHKEVQTRACGMKIAYSPREPDGAAVCLRFMTGPQMMSVQSWPMEPWCRLAKQSGTHVRKLKLEMRGCLGRLAAGEPSRGRHEAWCPRDFDFAGQQPSGYSLYGWWPVHKEPSSRLLLPDVDHLETPRKMTQCNSSTNFGLD